MAGRLDCPRVQTVFQVILRRRHRPLLALTCLEFQTVLVLMDLGTTSSMDRAFKGTIMGFLKKQSHPWINYDSIMLRPIVILTTRVTLSKFHMHVGLRASCWDFQMPKFVSNKIVLLTSQPSWQIKFIKFSSGLISFFVNISYQHIYEAYFSYLNQTRHTFGRIEVSAQPHLLEDVVYHQAGSNTQYAEKRLAKTVCHFCASLEVNLW